MKNKDFIKLWTSLPGRLLCLALSTVLATVVYFGVNAVVDPYGCRMAEGVTIGGLEVGGMTKSEARTALKAALEDSLYSQPLLVHLPEETLSLAKADTEVRVNVRKAVSAAYDYGRNDRVSDPAIPLLPYLELKESRIREILSAYSLEHNTALSQAQWTLEGQRPDLSTDAFDPSAPGQTLVLTLGVPQVQLDVDQIYAEILDAFDRAIPLCRSGSFAIEPTVIPEAVPELPDAAQILQEIACAPVSDSLDLQTYEFVHGAYGYGFFPEDVQIMIDSASYGETLEIPLTASTPEILGEQVYFRDVLGYCETKHTDDANRNTNLQLLCKALDGYIILPGEEFSYNMAVGERTAERGYKPATAYSGKRMIKDIGGGVCQGSTTLYNCALLADLEINERVCHGAKVGYIKLGLDAAVNWNTKTDLRFTNNFHFPMMIRAEVSDGYVKMQILGTDEKDYYVEMYCKSGAGDAATYARSYKRKIDKETGAVLSDELEAYSTYYELS